MPRASAAIERASPAIPLDLKAAILKRDRFA
jgi:hypothetical protein